MGKPDMPGWEVTELAPGVTQYKRADFDGVRYLAGTTHVHLHYLYSDEEADRLGHTVVELCCHGCGEALYVLFTLPPAEVKAPPEGAARLKALRDSFQERHRVCPNLVGTVLCPLDRSRVGTVDLRGVDLAGPTPEGGAE